MSDTVMAQSISLALFLFVYTLSAFGLWLIVGTSKVSLPAREWLMAPKRGRLFRLVCELAECPLCSGVWIGALAGVLGIVVVGAPWWTPLVGALYTGASLMSLDSLTTK